MSIKDVINILGWAGFAFMWLEVNRFFFSSFWSGINEDREKRLKIIKEIREPNLKINKECEEKIKKQAVVDHVKECDSCYTFVVSGKKKVKDECPIMADFCFLDERNILAFNKAVSEDLDSD